jgi:hypothetical protein
VFPDSPIRLGVIILEDLAILATQSDNVLEEGFVVSVNGIVGEEGRRHVHEISPVFASRALLVQREKNKREQNNWHSPKFCNIRSLRDSSIPKPRCDIHDIVNLLIQRICHCLIAISLRN